MVSCTLDSAKNSIVGKGYDYGFAGSFPVSASLMTPDQKKKLGSTPYQDFTLPPNTPPIISSPVRDGIYRNIASLQIEIRRPLDGNDKWYAGRKLEFDVEFQVNKETSIGGSTKDGGPKVPTTSLGKTWINVPAGTLGISPVLTTDAVTVALSKFIAQGGTSESGAWQEWRIRARVKDSMTKPWSAWQQFNVVVPTTTFMKAPEPAGSFDKSKIAPADKSAPMVKPGTPVMPVMPAVPPGPPNVQINPQQQGVQTPNNNAVPAPGGSTQRNMERLSR
jgi:hypothetical protein